MPHVVADCILGSGNNVRQVTSVSHNDGTTVRNAMTSGGATVSQQSGIRGEEVTTVSSADLAALVALNTSTFCSVGLYLTGDTITVPLKERSLGGQFASGSNHPALSGSDCLIIPTEFSATQDAEAGASCTFDIHWISSDGVTREAAGSTGNALASQAFNAEFALGKADVNGSDVSGVVGIAVRPGITLTKSSTNGGIYPTHISIQQVEPVVEITVNDIDTAVALAGGFTTTTAMNVYFRKRADGGTYVADITAQHIKFTFAAGIHNLGSLSANENADGTATIRVTGKALTASAASAIS